MGKIRTLAPLVPRGNGFTVAREPKQVDPHYLTDEHKAWRQHVLRNAGNQCQWVEQGRRCIKAAPLHRMFADHIVERTDGGDPLDVRNGQCLCGAHHTRKTAQARAARHGVKA